MKGYNMGPYRRMTPEEKQLVKKQILEMKKQGLSAIKIAVRLKISQRMVYDNWKEAKV